MCGYVFPTLSLSDCALEFRGSLTDLGVTVFNGMRNMSAHPGGVVAIQGLGGLGNFPTSHHFQTNRTRPLTREC